MFGSSPWVLADGMARGPAIASRGPPDRSWQRSARARPFSPHGRRQPPPLPPEFALRCGPESTIATRAAPTTDVTATATAVRPAARWPHHSRPSEGECDTVRIYLDPEEACRVRSKHKILRVHAGEVPRATPQTPSPGGTHDAQSSQGQGQPPFPVGSSAATGRRWTSAIPLLPSVSPSLLSLIHGASYRETAALLPSSSPRSTNLHLSLHILHLLHLTGTAPPCSMPSLGQSRSYLPYSVDSPGL